MNIKIKKIIAKKNKSKIVSLTAYSKNISKILDNYCDIILVGDSMANVLYGLSSTHKISLQNIIEHTQSVKKGIKKSLLVVNMQKGTYETKKMVDNDLLGGLTKMVFNTGHPGPQEIGCSPEFLEWLTDPVQNGGGALTDFGCYGANIATWFLEGQSPLRISCIAKQIKPDRYPDVDDDTTIVLEYPKQQVLIQASWNWSHNRKDMQVYGSNGYIDAKTSREMIVLENEKKGSYTHKPPSIASNQKDPFRLLLEVTKYNKKLPPFSLYSLENNVIVSKILSLAKKAAETNQTLNWNAL